MQADQALVAGILERDSEAFEALMARHEPQVRGRVLRIVRDPVASDDLAQEVFLRVWTRADQWHGKGSVEAWLMRIGTNLALNHLRSVRRRRCQPLTPPAPPIDDEEDDLEPAWMVDLAALRPDVLLELAEQRARVRRLVEALPEPKRKLLGLVYEAEMELAEAARHLGIPVGTAKSRLHYTIKQLAREWHALEQEE